MDSASGPCSIDGLERALQERINTVPQSRGKLIEQIELRDGSLVDITKYEDESQIMDIMNLVSSDLSEPYSIYTYRYFLGVQPEFTLVAYAPNRGKMIGVIIGKSEYRSKTQTYRGYIGMLAVDPEYRRIGLGRRLVHNLVRAMIAAGLPEIVLDAEATNSAALKLYESLGFVRDKYLGVYYLNGNSAYRLKLWVGS